MKNDKIVIEMDKKKLINYGLIIVGVFLVCVISFAVSNSKSEKYSEQAAKQEVDEDSILQTATKDASEVKEEERTAPNQIGVDDYLDLYNGNENKLVLFASPTCSYCKIAIPILENIIYKYHVEINYLNTGELSNEDNRKIMESDDYFSEGYGTPLMLVVKDGKIVDQIDGLVPKESYLEFMKEYGFME